MVVVVVVWGELVEFEQVEAEGVDLGQDAVECRPVQQAGEDGVGAVVLCAQGGEGR